MACSVTSETKAKFDALLRVSLNKKNTNSTNNLIEDEERGEDNQEVENFSLDSNEYVNKHFILDKFLQRSVKNNDEVMKPIPKVRKKLEQTSIENKSSIKTVKDRIEVINIRTNTTIDNVKEREKNNSVQSGTTNRTFEIRRKSSSSSSNKTYVKTEVGDIVVHDKPYTLSVHKINTAYSESSNSESLKTENPEEIELVQFSRNVSEKEKNDADLDKTSILYENEKKRTKKQTKSETKKENDKIKYNYEKIVTISIHRTDRLKLNKFIVHPVVKIHIVNYETGCYVKKTDENRSVVMYLENKGVNYMMPVITQSFNLRSKRRFYPEWEETIIINEDFKYFMEEDQKIMFLFEVMDFVNFDVASTQPVDSSRGWHNIAWAFLKLRGSDNSTNTNKKLRLQLYKPGKSKKGTACQVYDWWKHKRIKYPSTLYVTVKPIVLPDTVTETFRSKTPMEREKAHSVLDGKEICGEDNIKLLDEEKEKVEKVLRNLQDKTSVLPNKLHAELNSGDEGCFALKFSNSGQYLACAVLLNEIYTLVMYLAPNFDQFYKLACHQGLIYNISFSRDDRLVLTSSADGTVSIWDLHKMKFMQMLPHPSFVYWCEILRDNYVATGCFDKTIRVWAVSDSKILKYELADELDGHDGYVTSLCINSQSDYMYSTDSIGVIICWRRNHKKWDLWKKIVLPELKNTVLNQVLLHNKENRLIVHSRDSIIRVVDVKTECVIHWLEGATNNRVRTLCCTSPCYTYIFAGGENGNIHVWNIDTGKMVAMYSPYTKLSVKDLTIHALHFCTKSNMLAFSHFGHKIPIFIYSLDPINGNVNLLMYATENPWKNATEMVLRKEKCGHSQRHSKSDQHIITLKQILEKIDNIIN